MSGEGKKTKAELLAEAGYSVAPCKGCGVPVVWAIGPSGSKIPLSARIPVYTVVKIKSEDHAIPNGLSFGSHFIDCPKRELFKK